MRPPTKAGIMYLEFFHSPSLPSSSILHPLYVWVAHTLVPNLRVDEYQIICGAPEDSEQELTKLFQQVSKRRVVAALNTILQERIFDAELPWDQQPVNGATLTTLYRALVEDTSEAASRVKEAMTHTVHRFGIPYGYALQSGWAMIADHELTLLLVVLPLDEVGDKGRDGTFILLVRSEPISSSQKGTWLTLSQQDEESLVEVHADFFAERN